MFLYPRTHRATCFKEMAHFCVCSLTQYFLLARKVSQGRWSACHAVAHHSGNTSDFWKQARLAPQQELSASVVKGLKSTLPLSLLRRWNISPLSVLQTITLRKARKLKVPNKTSRSLGHVEAVSFCSNCSNTLGINLRPFPPGRRKCPRGANRQRSKVHLAQSSAGWEVQKHGAGF